MKKNRTARVLVISEKYGHPFTTIQSENKISFEFIIVNTPEAAASDFLKLQPEGLIVELSHPVYRIQSLMGKLHAGSFMPQLLFFEIVSENQLYYTKSKLLEEKLPGLELAFQKAFSNHFCTTCLVSQDQIWNSRFADDCISPMKQEGLREILYGISWNSFQRYRKESVYQLQPRRGYYLFLIELTAIVYEDHITGHDCYSYLGGMLREEFREVLKHYSGGEVFSLAPNNVYIYINQPDTRSNAAAVRMVRSLTQELCMLCRRYRSICFMSPFIQQLSGVRQMFDLYLQNREKHFFLVEKWPLTVEDLVFKSLPVSYSLIQEKLEKIKDAILYAKDPLIAEMLIRDLFCETIKDSQDISLFYYCFYHLKYLFYLTFSDDEIVHELEPPLGEILPFFTIEEVCEDMIIWLQKLFSDNQYSPKAKYQYVFETVRYIREHYHEKFTVAEIADKMHVNRDYLGRLFKNRTGQTVISYINDYRLGKAKEYLKGTDYSVNEIAERTGFESGRYFSRVFRKKCGMSPKEYRKDAGKPDIRF